MASSHPAFLPASAPYFAPVKPRVLVVETDDIELLRARHGRLLALLGAECEVVEALSFVQAVVLAQPDSTRMFAAILISSSSTPLENKDFGKLLVHYVKSGGTVIFCCLFSSTVSSTVLDNFWHADWGLPWKYGGYHHETFVRNMDGIFAMAADQSGLAREYNQNTLCLKGVVAGAAVYVTSLKSRLEGISRGAGAVDTPMAFQLYAHKGFVGFVGDVYGEPETDRAILAMCRQRYSLAAQPTVTSLHSRPLSTPCQTCHSTEQSDGAALMVCARCYSVRYCSALCQKADWWQHKPTCMNARQARPGLQSALTVATFAKRDTMPSREDSGFAAYGADGFAPTTVVPSAKHDPIPFQENTGSATYRSMPISKPFHLLLHKTYLNRPPKDVFRILIDAYRLRVADDMKGTKHVINAAYRGFEGFMEKFQHQGTWCPPWWDHQKLTECLAFAHARRWSGA